MIYPAAALVIAFAAAVAITPATAVAARRLGILDRPGDGGAGHKAHETATPYLGGLAIFAGMSLGALMMLAAPLQSSIISTYGTALGAALILGVIGLADDVRPLPRSLRLVAQIAVALLAWGAGFRIQALPGEVLDLALTLIWIVGITNAFNLLDNMDGLSAGIAGVSATSFAVIAATGGLGEVAIMAAAVAGASFGFLAHNRHPAKIFMGDAGSLFLGYLLALLGIELKFNNLVAVTFLVPVIVLGIPIFDTTLVVLSRLRHKRPVLLGGRDHASHRLVKVGLPVKAAVALLYWAGLCLGWLGLVISRSTVQVGWMLLGFVIALGIFFGFLLFQVPVYEATRDEEPEGVLDADELLASR